MVNPVSLSLHFSADLQKKTLKAISERHIKNLLQRIRRHCKRVCLSLRSSMKVRKCDPLQLWFMRVTFMKWRAVSGGEGKVMPSDSLQTSISQTDGVTSRQWRRSPCERVCVCVYLWHSLACSTRSWFFLADSVSSCSVELNTSSSRWHWRVLQKHEDKPRKH